jgi:hypothetical protein
MFAAGGCHFYFARQVTFQPCADTNRSFPGHLQSSNRRRIYFAIPHSFGGPAKEGAKRSVGMTASCYAQSHRARFRDTEFCFYPADATGRSRFYLGA